MNRAYITTILLFILTSPHAQNKALEIAMDSMISTWQRDSAPALSVAVVKNGSPIYKKTVGMAVIKEGQRNDSTTRFWVASVTKQFTAAGIYLLTTQRKVNVNFSIRYYLAELPIVFQPVTIDQLLHHTSGIRDGFVLTALSKKPEEYYTNENVINYLTMQNDMNFKPGTGFEYNNSGYVLLAKVIEKVSGMPYPEFMKKNLFLPLGMTSTNVSGTFPEHPKQARGYHISQTPNQPPSFEEQHFQGNTYGSTGLITTLNDLIRWSQVIQFPEKTRSFKPIIGELLKLAKLRDGTVVKYGGGLEKFMYKNKPVYEHFGADAGFKANHLYFPTTKLSIIGMTNDGGYYGLSQLLYNIADLVNKEKRPGPQFAKRDDDSVISTAYYFNEEMPKFLRVQNYSAYSKISETPTGYAATYTRVKDRLQSQDPIPTIYRLAPGRIMPADSNNPHGKELVQIIPNKKTDDLKGMEGEYYSAELKTPYRIVVTTKGLALEFAPGITFDMFRLTESAFIFDYVGANILQFSGDGLTFSREGCRKLIFKRTPIN